MNFSSAEAKLRSLVLRAIDTGELSGAQLARRSGVGQAHVCNWLHSRRGMSVQALDQISRVCQYDLAVGTYSDPHTARARLSNSRVWLVDVGGQIERAPTLDAAWRTASAHGLKLMIEPTP